MLKNQTKTNSHPLSKINGDKAEQLAKHYLEKEGLIFIESNFLCRFGEIDLIFTDTKNIIFVEVRFRFSLERGSAAESITRSKQNKISKSALYWLKNRNLELSPIRFDAVLFDGEICKHNLNWIKAIF